MQFVNLTDLLLSGKWFLNFSLVNATTGIVNILPSLPLSLSPPLGDIPACGHPMGDSRITHQNRTNDSSEIWS